MATKKKTSVAKRTTTEHVRKLQRQTNGSTTVALPPELFRELRWRDKQKVVVRKRGDTLVVQDWKPKKKKK